MNGKIVSKIVATLVLIAAIAGIGAFAFRAGVAKGSPITIQAPSGESVNAPSAGESGRPMHGYGYGMGPGFGHHMPFFGFGCFGLLLPLFLFFIAMKAFRMLFWGHHMHGHGPWRHGWGGEGGVPPMFNEWHKRAHGESAPATEDKKE